MQQIKIFDTTLRDGEQAPGFSMNQNEKLKIAHQLEQLNVDIIEAGFAVVSPGDFASVHQIAKEIRNCSVCSLSRALKKDIEASAKALEPAADPTIHIFIATSPIHMQYKLHMEPEAVLDQISQMVALGKKYCAKIEFSAEDASRSDRDFLCQAFSRAAAAGATTLNIPDTVGYATPDEFADLVGYVKAHAHCGNAALSVHCHNDLGMAVANSIAAISAGATQIECALTGIGERAGNAALEEVVMAIETRKQHLNAQTRIQTSKIHRATSKLSRIIGLTIPPNKAIIGANAFAHESGIHQHGVLANRATYEIMTPESVGILKNSIILGKHSGKHAFSERLSAMGYHLEDAALEELFQQFKILSDKKKEITDFDLEALVDTLSKTEKYYELDRFVINSGNTIRPTAIVRIRHKDQLLEDVAIGDGPIFACYAAIDKMVGMPLQLDDYSIRSITEGGDAQGQVTVKVSNGHRRVTGRGLSTDILESSIRAYLHAINKLISLEAQA